VWWSSTILKFIVLPEDSAQAATLGKFKDRLAYLAGLDALGPTEQWLEGHRADHRSLNHPSGPDRPS